MRELKKKWIFPLACLLGVLVLAACSAGEDPAPEAEVTTLIYARLSENGGANWEAIRRFNRTHDDVQIEVKDYNTESEDGRQGIQRLMTEIAAGHIPDIIELGSSGEACILPYRRLAEEGYLEDLWPYIENDPELGREKVVEAPLKAAEVNGGLYTVFDSAWIHTLVGAESVVGDRTSWTLEDLREALASMPEETAVMDNITATPVLAPLTTAPASSMKYRILTSYIYGFFDLLVDWENSQCFFESEQFRNILEFANSMHGEPEWWEEVYDSWGMHRRMVTGEAMLTDEGYSKPHYQRCFNFYFGFGGQAVPVGYPVEDGSVGSYFEPMGIKLAMSSTCKDKEAAWEYIRQTLLFKDNFIYDYSAGIPVNKKSYNSDRRVARSEKWFKIHLERYGEGYNADALSAEEWEKLEAYFNSVTRCSLFSDTRVLDIVLEEASVYFAGDITLDQTAARIQSRATLYVNEQR